MKRARRSRRAGQQPAAVTGPFGGSTAERARFWLLIGLLALCLFGGGSNRADAISLLWMRPLLIIGIAAMLLIPGQRDFTPVKTPMILLGVLAGWMVLQLVPLPPALWIALPGHAPYAEAARAAGFAQPWRPISLTPDLSWNSLLALLPAAGALLGFASIRSDQQVALAPVAIGAACLSAVLGIAQLASGPFGGLYIYADTQNTFPVGFLANRNHQAVLLASAFPLLRLWAATPAAAPSGGVRVAIAAGVALLLIAMILATGSRAGIAVAALGLIGAALVVPIGGGTRLFTRRNLLILAGTSVALIAIIVVVTMSGRAAAIDRLLAFASYESELRLRFFPLTVRIAGDFLPFGSGFGSFDAVFRSYEPDAALGPQYFNRAHNDLLELGLTGGVPALALLAIFLVWLGRCAITAFGPGMNRHRRVRLARAGLIVIAMMLVASLVDYPLRTAAMSFVFALACGWVGLARRGELHSNRLASNPTGGAEPISLAGGRVQA